MLLFSGYIRKVFIWPGLYFEMTDKTLFDLINKLREGIRQRLPEIRQDIDGIIERGERDQMVVERELDFLLPLCQLGFCDEEFRRLNDYFRAINPNSAEDYDKFYREMVEDETRTD